MCPVPVRHWSALHDTAPVGSRTATETRPQSRLVTRTRTAQRARVTAATPLGRALTRHRRVGGATSAGATASASGVRRQRHVGRTRRETTDDTRVTPPSGTARARRGREKRDAADGGAPPTVGPSLSGSGLLGSRGREGLAEAFHVNPEALRTGDQPVWTERVVER